MYPPSRSWPWSSALIAVLGLLAPRSAVAAPALDRPVTTDVEAPTGEATPPQPSSPASNSGTTAPISTDPATSSAPTSTSTTAPTSATSTSATSTSATPAVSSTTTSPSEAESLLGPSEGTPPTSSPATPPPSEAKAAADDDAATTDFYRQFYRPSSNPGRLNIVPRVTYTILGSGDGAIAGRMAGFTADVGQSWNTIGYALTLTANVGDLSLRADDMVKAFTMLGGGPTVNLGRLALLQRGYLDLRAGYDFFYAPARSFDAAVTAQSRAPHGPRLQINMGLILHPGRTKRYFQGIGVTVGYQGLVGSLVGGPMPYTSVLMFGMSYWIG